MDNTRVKIEALVKEASPDTQKLIMEVINLERPKLHMSSPSGMDRAITETVKDLVK